MIQVCAKHHNQSWLNSPRALPTPSSLPANSLPRRNPLPLATSRSEDPLAKVQVSNGASNRWCSLVNDVVRRRLFWVLLVEKKTSTWNILKKQPNNLFHVYIYIYKIQLYTSPHACPQALQNIKRAKSFSHTKMSNMFYHPAPLWNQSQNASIYFSTHPNLPCRPKKTELLSFQLLNSLTFLSFPKLLQGDA